MQGETIPAGWSGNQKIEELARKSKKMSGVRRRELRSKVQPTQSRKYSAGDIVNMFMELNRKGEVVNVCGSYVYKKLLRNEEVNDADVLCRDKLGVSTKIVRDVASAYNPFVEYDASAKEMASNEGF